MPRPGDTVVTSGVALPSSGASEILPFPRGLPLGTVRESTRLLEENEYYVVVEPIADFRYIEEVLILRYEPAVQPRPAGEEIVEQQMVGAPTARPQPTGPGAATPQPLPNAPGRPASFPEDGLEPDDDVIHQPG